MPTSCRKLGQSGNKKNKHPSPLEPMIKQCKHCGKQFEHKKLYYVKNYCSTKCRCRNAKKDSLWSDAELELLKSFVGYKPIQEIIAEWNNHAKKHGWKERTPYSIKIRFQRLDIENVSYKTIYDNWSMIDVAKKLDINVERIQKWESEGLIIKKYSIEDGYSNRAHKTAISQNNLKTFSVNHPGSFWGICPARLSKILGDSQLAKEIVAVANQPTVGRAMVVIRLDNGEVYRSAHSAAAALDVSKTLVLKSCQKDDPCRNGMDFARIDYPVYWVPVACRDEFNRLAGETLYQIYLEIKEIQGYKKTSCLIVCTRTAVQITLFAFRRNLREQSNNEPVTAKEIIVKFWHDRHLSLIKKHIGYGDSSLSNERIKKTATYKVYHIFLAVYGDSGKMKMHLETFVNDFINQQIIYYFEKACLPKYYKPMNRLEYADLYTFVEGATSVYIRERKNFLIVLKAYHYIKYNPPLSDYSEEILAYNNQPTHEIEVNNTFDEIIEVVKTKLGIAADIVQECVEYVKFACSGVEDICLEMGIDAVRESIIINTLKQAAAFLDSPF